MPRKSPLPRGIDMPRPGVYRARIFVDGTQCTLGRYQTLKDAQAALDIARGEKARGIFVPPKVQRDQAKAEREAQREAARRASVTVADVYAAWMGHMETAGLKQSTRETHAARWRAHIRRRFARVPIAEVTPEDVAAWHKEVKGTGKSAKPGAARGAYQTLSTLFRFATGQGPTMPHNAVRYVDASPCQLPQSALTGGRETPERETATPAEVQTLADHMPDGQGLIVLLSAWCGLRRGEALALRRRDVANEGGVYWLHINGQINRSKNGKGLYRDSPKSRKSVRTVPVPSRIAPALEQHITDWAGPGRDGLIFPRDRRGTALTTPETVGKRFRAAVEALNAEATAHGKPTLHGFTLHHLRHTALTRLGEAGASLEELRAVAGHSSYDVVARYQHATRERLAALADRMGDA